MPPFFKFIHLLFVQKYAHNHGLLPEVSRALRAHESGVGDRVLISSPDDESSEDSWERRDRVASGSAADAGSTARVAAAAQVEQYLTACELPSSPPNVKVPVLQWWKEVGIIRYPFLAPVALKYLALSPTDACVERFFKV